MAEGDLPFFHNFKLDYIRLYSIGNYCILLCLLKNQSLQKKVIFFMILKTKLIKGKIGAVWQKKINN